MKTSRGEVRALWPVTKAGEVPLMRVFPWGPAGPIQYRFQSGVAPVPPAKVRADKMRKAFAPHETRHNFVVETLQKPGPFRSRPYLYTCMRCKWSFRVNDRPGSIIALADNGRPMPEPERSGRAETFANGPCPAFGDIGRRVTQIQQQGWFAAVRHQLARQLEALWRRWSNEEDGHVPRDSHTTTMIMPQDLLR